MYYDIIYKRKSDPSKKEWKYIDEQQLDGALRQLKNMATTFKGEVVLGISDLDFIEIEERTYAYFQQGEYYLRDYDFDSQDGPIETFSPIEYFEAMGRDDEIPDSFYAHDVTNEMLYKYGICGDDYKKIGKVILEDNILYANAYKFKLDKGKKTHELFDLIFRAKEFYKKLSFTYDELKFVYKNSGVKYEELEPYLSKENIDDILGRKLRDIRTKTGMKEKIIENNGGIVSIRQEPAM